MIYLTDEDNNKNDNNKNYTNHNNKIYNDNLYQFNDHIYGQITCMPIYNKTWIEKLCLSVER